MRSSIPRTKINRLREHQLKDVEWSLFEPVVAVRISTESGSLSHPDTIPVWWPLS